MQPCKFPHDLHSSHNLAILQRLFLDEVRPVDLYSRLQEKFERKLKLCGFYDTDEGCKGGEMCQYLHFCRYHIKGTCKYEDDCNYNHDILGENCKDVLVQFGIKTDQSVEEIIRTVRSRLNVDVEVVQDTADDSKRSIAHTKLKLCGFYETDEGCKGGKKCQYLHFCRYHIKGTCKYEDDCNYNHDILGENCKDVLVQFGIKTDQSVDEIIRTVRSLLKIEVAKVVQDPADNSNCSIDLTKKTEICSYNIRGYCHSGDLCDKIHHNLPYMWLYSNGKCSGNKWMLFDPDEQVDIEKDYCNVNKSSTNINDCERFVSKLKEAPSTAKLRFDVMMILNRQVHRVSTRGCVFEPSSTPFTTNWEWYWKEDEDLWTSYTKQGRDAMQSDKDSDELEELYQYYLSGQGEAVVHFSTSVHHTYKLSFQEMKQTNKVHGKKRDVRRRPRKMVTISDINIYKENWQAKKRTLKAMTNQHMIKNPLIVFPKIWSYYFDDLDESKDFCLVEVKQGSDEYDLISNELTAVSPKKVRDLEIQRIHNFELWEDFYKKRNQMSDEIEGKNVVTELILWYGTSSHAISTICQQNFDVSKHPTTAPVSFTSRPNIVACMRETVHSGLHKLFRVRVLINKVEEYSKYKPCAKNDCSATCDSVSDPSAYTVFNKDQLYPEYLFTFKY
ncbi:protein mono-ADP-ribosyltransferase PARP12-like [Anneissia japonica]|uniref:protein mono-ADP-ribosyltransferase PARP12-like n=1 Tax=Anneissia japonica TaxID=1529436 RepID=UPI001425B21A|nr:protein mono-ADP-ribosyltransferase PARP12-like [Anneissia japonica]